MGFKKRATVARRKRTATTTQPTHAAGAIAGEAAMTGEQPGTRSGNAAPHTHVAVRPPEAEPGPASLDAYVAEFDDTLAGIVLRLAELIREVAPEAHEGIKWGMPHYAQSGHLVYIDAKSDHVNLGFFRGDELATQDEARGLFLGAGGRLRHIRLYATNNIPEAAIRALVAAAVELNQSVARS